MVLGLRKGDPQGGTGMAKTKKTRAEGTKQELTREEMKKIKGGIASGRPGGGITDPNGIPHHGTMLSIGITDPNGIY